MATTASNSNEPLRRLAADHRALADALEGLLSATYLGMESREGRLRRLRLALEAHEALEENAFYPAVAELGPEAAALISQAREAHRGIAAATRAIEQSQPAPLTWASCAQRLADALRAHVEFEERHIFAAARQLGPARLARLGATLTKLHEAYAHRPDGPIGRSSPASRVHEPPRQARPAPGRGEARTPPVSQD